MSYLRGEDFQLYPDFPTGGAIDVSKYNDGQRGGMVRVRAKIEKLDTKTLVIREVPYSKTAASLQDSITKAIEKGKIKARRVIDMTARQVEIQVQLAPGVSSDKTIDALYAFTDCEINISPNCCVIDENRPEFLTVGEVLRHNVDRTMGLLRQELLIRKDELEEQFFFASLERIFIEERMYKEKRFEQAPNQEAVIGFLDEKFSPFKEKLIREIRQEDYLRLLEIKMQRILKYNKEKAEQLLARIKAEIKGINHDLAHMTNVTIAWYEHLKETYGKDYPRLTEIRSFDTIEAATVVEANEKLYINRQDGFIGTGLKKDELVCSCSDLDDIIIFYRDGKYKIIKVADKIFVGKNIIWLQVFKKNDSRTIYNVVYRDGKRGSCFIKRFNVTSMTRDREYDLTQGTPGSRVMYFTANPNGEAEVIKVTLDPEPKKKKQNIFLEKDFSEIAIKGRTAKGNLLTKKSVHRVTLKSHGRSTLGGRKVWFDPDVNRINYEEHGRLLGEFNDGESILVVLNGGDFYITDFDVNNHFEKGIRIIEKWNPEKVWTAVLFDADNEGYPYVKRFLMDATKRRQNYIGENPNSQLVLLTDTVYPRIQVTFGGNDAVRPPMEIDVESFIAVKGFKAKGKRIATWQIDKIEELEPLRMPDPVTMEDDDEDKTDTHAEETDPDAGKSQQQIIDEMTGQLSLFPDTDNLG